MGVCGGLIALGTLSTTRSAGCEHWRVERVVEGTAHGTAHRSTQPDRSIEGLDMLSFPKFHSRCREPNSAFHVEERGGERSREGDDRGDDKAGTHALDETGGCGE